MGADMNNRERLSFLILGGVFGWVLSRSGASDYDYIQRMFLLEDFQLFGIIGGAVAFGAPLLWWLKRQGKTYGGEPLQVSHKPYHRGVIPGGILFGVGWSLTGMCPGPILVNMGEGKWTAFAAFFGALCGAYLYGLLRPSMGRFLQIAPDDSSHSKLQ